MRERKAKRNRPTYSPDEAARSAHRSRWRKRNCTEGLAKLVADEDEISLSAAMLHPEYGTLHVGGTVIGGTVPDAEAAIDAANEAGDAEALAELLLGKVKRDRGGLWRYTDQWQEVPLPTDNPVIDLFALPADTVILCSEAEILSAKHGEAFERMSDARPDGYLEGFCGLQDRVLLSFSKSTYTFDARDFAPLADAPFPGKFHDLVESPLGLLAAAGKKVLLLDGDKWRGLRVKKTEAPRISVGASS